MWQLEVACELLLTECRLVTAGVLSKKGSFQIGAVLWVGMFLWGLGKRGIRYEKGIVQKANTYRVFLK
jgi:hypothetical protein